MGEITCPSMVMAFCDLPMSRLTKDAVRFADSSSTEVSLASWPTITVPSSPHWTTEGVVSELVSRFLSTVGRSPS